MADRPDLFRRLRDLPLLGRAADWGLGPSAVSRNTPPNLRGTFVLTRAALPHLRESDHAHVLSLSPPISADPKWLRGHSAYTVAQVRDDDGHPRRRSRRGRCRHRREHPFVDGAILIASGVNAKAISTYMGHGSIANTYDRYGHLMPGSEIEVRALLDAYLDGPT